MLKVLGQTVEDGARRQYAIGMAKKNFGPQDVAAGRGYVAVYVEYIHYIEGLYQAREKTAGHARAVASEGHGH